MDGRASDPFFPLLFIVVMINTENKGKWEEEGLNSGALTAQMFTIPNTMERYFFVQESSHYFHTKTVSWWKSV